MGNLAFKPIATARANTTPLSRPAELRMATAIVNEALLGLGDARQFLAQYGPTPRGADVLSALWRRSFWLSSSARWGAFVPADLRLPERHLVERLFARSVKWNMNALSHTQSDSHGRVVLDDLMKMAYYQEMTPERFFQYWGVDTTFFDSGKIEESRKRVTEGFEKLRISLGAIRETLNRRSLERRIANLLELASQARADVALFLFTAKQLAEPAGLQWNDLLEIHSRHRTRYEKRLVRLVRARGGAIGFDEFFRMAMFDSQNGIYTGSHAENLIGNTVTKAPLFFTTSSEYKSFGALLLYQIRDLWRELGRPATFDVVEMGAGRGSLAQTILQGAETLAPTDPDWAAFHAALSYRIVEISPRMAELQRRRLQGLPVKIHVASALSEDLPRIENGLFLSNELIDMFPPIKVVAVGDEIYEVGIQAKGDRLEEVLIRPRPSVLSFLERHETRLKKGDSFYIQPDIETWVQGMANRMERGFVLSIDYGGDRDTLLKERHDGWTPSFRGFPRYRFSQQFLRWLRRPAAKAGLSDLDSSVGVYFDTPTAIRWPRDLTVDVDFTTVEAAARASGLVPVLSLTQRGFLDGIRHRHRLLDDEGFLSDGFLTRVQLDADLNDAVFMGTDDFYVSLLKKG